mgnify:CR=1 FL=1
MAGISEGMKEAIVGYVISEVLEDNIDLSFESDDEIEGFAALFLESESENQLHV